jgi:hypothetical protein
MSIHRSPRVCLHFRYCLVNSERQYEPKNRAIAAGGGEINPAPKVLFAKQLHRKSADAPSRLSLGAEVALENPFGDVCRYFPGIPDAEGRPDDC